MMDHNAKYATGSLFEQVASDLEDMLKVPAVPLPTDEIIPHVGLEVNVAGDEWIPATQVLWRSWTGRRKVWGMEYHGPVFNIDRDDSVPFSGKRVCGCAICQEHVSPEMKPN
jgi:hypothetical protein